MASKLEDQTNQQLADWIKENPTYIDGVLARERILQSRSDFCRHCGANIPPIPGEGTCDKCPKRET